MYNLRFYSGNTWGLYWKFPGIFEGKGETPAVVQKVSEILNMWTLIETSYDRLPADDKERIKADGNPSVREARFSGFDGNHETEQMGIALFLVEELGRYANFKGRHLNSHMPSLDGYERMLTAFQPLLSSLGSDYLTATQIIQLLKAQDHRQNDGKATSMPTLES